MHLVLILFLLLRCITGFNSDDAPVRDVYMQITVDLAYLQRERYEIGDYDPQKFATVATHPFLEIIGDGEVNGNMRMELSMSSRGMVALARDYGIHNRMDAPVSRLLPKTYIKSIKIGVIAINNKDLFDFSTGKGIVTDAWSRNTNYRIMSHNCVDFMQTLVTELGLDPGDDFRLFYAHHRSNQGATGLRPDFGPDNCPVMGIHHSDAVNPKREEVFIYDVTDKSNPILKAHENPLVPDNRPITNLPEGAEFKATDNGVERKLSTITEIEAYAGPNPPDDVQTIREQAQAPDAENQPFVEDPSNPNAMGIQEVDGRGILHVEGTAELSVVRSRGVVYNIASIAKTTLLDVGGVVATAVLPVFIILDLVNGDWKAAALGAASGLAGIGTALLGSGPVGLLVGAAVGILFAIIPGLFNEKSPPPTNNPSKIIQFAFFGDADHTGNEACNKQRAQAHQEQNCTAVYGAGTLSKVLNINIFDAFVILIMVNLGQPVGILDLSSHFPVKDYTMSNWANNQSMYIDCGPAPKPQPLPGYSGGSIPGYRPPSQSPSSGYDCKKPKFIVNRTLITLPQLDATADKIYSRIIPAPGGDCKMYSDPVNGQKVPFLDITLTGRPVGIECNLTLNDSIGVDPTINYYSTDPVSKNITEYSPGSVLVYSPLTNTSTNYTLPNSNTTSRTNNTSPSSSPLPVLRNNQTTTTSTDNSTLRGYRTPPPPTPFLSYNASNAICLSNTTSLIVCLPNGTYPTGDQALKLNVLISTTQVTFPHSNNLSSSISWTYPASFDQANSGRYPNSFSAGDEAYTSSASFSSNVTTSSPQDQQRDFKTQIGNLIAGPKSFDAFLPAQSSLPGLCLFTSKDYKGSVQCFGLGAANVTGPIGGWAKSIAFKYGAGAWIYSGKYGDLTGQYLNTDVPDLSQVRDGTEKNFENRIAGMWISIPV